LEAEKVKVEVLKREQASEKQETQLEAEILANSSVM
jgi:hypothetical protein